MMCRKQEKVAAFSGLVGDPTQRRHADQNSCHYHDCYGNFGKFRARPEPCVLNHRHLRRLGDERKFPKLRQQLLDLAWLGYSRTK